MAEMKSVDIEESPWAEKIGQHLVRGEKIRALRLLDRVIEYRKRPRPAGGGQGLSLEERGAASVGAGCLGRRRRDTVVNEAARIAAEHQRFVRQQDLARAMKDNPPAFSKAKIESMKARIGFV